MGNIKAICLSEKRGIQKTCKSSASFRINWGIEGDAHAEDWHRQVSFLSYEKIMDFRSKGAEVEFGDFGENLVIEGFDFRKLPVGTQLRCNDVLLEMTQIGKECHTRCAIFHKMGDCIMPREGVFARVLEPGTINVGDEIVIEARKTKRPYQAAVITLSDRCSRGEREDTSGPALAEHLSKAGYEIIEMVLLADDKDALKHHLQRLADQRQLDLILTTGGTGFAPRDITPEATQEVATRNVPGIAEAIRAFSLQITPSAMLMRGVSIIRNKTLIINLPGSKKASTECLDFIAGSIPHGLDLLRNEVIDCARI